MRWSPQAFLWSWISSDALQHDGHDVACSCLNEHRDRLCPEMVPERAWRHQMSETESYTGDSAECCNVTGRHLNSEYSAISGGGRDRSPFTRSDQPSRRATCRHNPAGDSASSRESSSLWVTDPVIMRGLRPLTFCSTGSNSLIGGGAG